ncbi:aldolase/citrate lyase family protein [Microlunatus aurantiacus]|uniref:Aldolase/citrate lyase family protein n=1 Tax=Microlunatus aurantiacus TaxID=446786 RepID=A0ABP7DSX1_9ACTN
MTAAAFADRARNHQPVVGYWMTLASPLLTERLAGVGYDYVVLDAQHGELDGRAQTAALIAVDAAAGASGLVRVEANHATPIGRALDAGAAGVIVPLVNSAEDAAAAVAASRYPPAGIRSFGPLRSDLRIGPAPTEANATVLVLAMIETSAGLHAVEEIAATPGLDGIYIGPSDLALGVGAAYPGDPAADDALAAALVLIREACEAAGIIAGIHTPSGEVAAQRLAEGFTLVTVAHDVGHLVSAAATHLETARR